MYTDAHARFLFILPPKGDEYLIKLESSEKKRRREWHFAAINLASSLVLINKEKYRICSSLSRAWGESIWWISTEAKVFFLVRRLNVLKAFFFSFFELQGVWERKVTWRSYLAFWVLSNTPKILTFLSNAPVYIQQHPSTKGSSEKTFRNLKRENKLHRVSCFIKSISIMKDVGKRLI